VIESMADIYPEINPRILRTADIAYGRCQCEDSEMGLLVCKRCQWAILKNKGGRSREQRAQTGVVSENPGGIFD
jgi:hypothetical protein